MPDQISVVVTIAAIFIGFHVAWRLLASGCPAIGVDNLSVYTQPGTEAGPAGPVGGFDRMAVRGGRPCRYGSHEGAVRGVGVRAGRPLCGLGRRPPIAREPSRLRRVESRGIHQRSRGVPSCGGAPPRLRKFQQCLPRQYDGAVRRDGHTADSLCLYAFTKTANEAMADSYAHLFGLPCCGAATRRR